MCTKAALREALAWGAQPIVVGDLTDEDLNRTMRCWSILAALPVPLMVIQASDGGDRSRGDGGRVAASHGVALDPGAWRMYRGCA
jgi:hypothetical protein